MLIFLRKKKITVYCSENTGCYYIPDLFTKSFLEVNRNNDSGFVLPVFLFKLAFFYHLYQISPCYPVK